MKNPELEYVKYTAKCPCCNKYITTKVVSIIPLPRGVHISYEECKPEEL